MRALRLRQEPTVRQINRILARVESDLAARGLDVSRHGVGGLHFKVPPPWRTRRAGLLGAATSGKVRVTAGRGERRHVRYELKFTMLQAILMLASFVLVIVGWQRARVSLVGSVALLWFFIYLPAYFIATRQLQRIVATGARDVIDRRRTPRDTPTAGPTDTPVDTPAAGTARTVDTTAGGVPLAPAPNEPPASA